MPFRQLIPVYLFTLPTVSLRKLTIILNYQSITLPYDVR